ncbi:hypothetical protein BGZ72_004772 [Mortierella alpina]|nr:hypothetical protein BGZ72_004772 [Mortierella alpina]
MARSTLFALLVLALIQVVLALPYGYKMIINVAAKGALIGDPYKSPNRAPTVERNSQGFAYNMWGIDPTPEGGATATIFMPPAYSFLSFTPDFGVTLSREAFAWAIHSAGGDNYIIKLPNNDLVLNWDERYGDVSMSPANGSPGQLWQIGSSFSYNRMFSQF